MTNEKTYRMVVMVPMFYTVEATSPEDAIEKMGSPKLHRFDSEWDMSGRIDGGCLDFIQEIGDSEEEEEEEGIVREWKILDDGKIEEVKRDA